MMGAGKTNWWPALMFPPINLWSVPTQMKEQQKYHEYSVERLYHFKCSDCKKWWSIGDYHLSRNDDDRLKCPYCGIEREANPIPK